MARTKQVTIHLFLVAQMILIASGQIGLRAQHKENDGSTLRTGFRYWSERTLLDDIHGIVLLGEVIFIGEETPLREGNVEGVTKRMGSLTVEKFLRLPKTFDPSNIRTVVIENAHRLSLGDHVVVFVDAEKYGEIYVINDHRGTNCSAGINLGKAVSGSYSLESANELIRSIEKPWTGVLELPAEEIRIWSEVDPYGVLEELLRDLELRRLEKLPEGAVKSNNAVKPSK